MVFQGFYLTQRDFIHFVPPTSILMQVARYTRKFRNGIYLAYLPLVTDPRDTWELANIAVSVVPLPKPLGVYVESG
jgi:hypothetical protein